MFSIQVFEPTGAEVTSFVEPGSGICWFHAGSMAETLDFTNSYRYLPTVLQGHEYKEVKQGTGRPSLYVREEGVYMLIMESKSVYAARFKRWLAYEVLPSIRKSGSFGSVPNVESGGSEFWQLIDGAIARNLEPKEAIALHHQWSGLDKIDTIAPNPSVLRKTESSNKFTDEILLSKIRVLCSRNDGWVTIRECSQYIKSLKGTANAKKRIESLVSLGKVESEKRGKTTAYRAK